MSADHHDEQGHITESTVETSTTVTRYAAWSLRDRAMCDLGTDRETALYLLKYAADGSHPWRLAGELHERTETTHVRIGPWLPERTTPPGSTDGGEQR